ncbi:fluoride efflux transporter CrcB [Arenibaculum pallidiluteum]|uniref:fluoride efflux transporter CrcB n=1 Tax=Arenibaculum pallidiluteum TaxID=2812559 RepID=UPI001A95C08F|nr:fluoride efflux transporter CrcB [Arenibaculum pallidiluteum]
MSTVLAVAAGGAIGSVARYLVGVAALLWLGPGFPYGTLAVNVVGSFLMGVVAGLGTLVWQPPAELRAFLATGILGGFTTFSTFSLDLGLMIERGDFGAAAVYTLASMILSVVGLFVGMWLVRMGGS